ncbi:MAG TPA: DUF3105 domain-containing protein [Micromonosporaceae bacterium]|nr:DUF3105 domain-containing protein [Micromonosporaceae bacterium]
MSMSTGDSRRSPFSTKATKATATDDQKSGAKKPAAARSGSAGKLLDRPPSAKGGRTPARPQTAGKGGKGRRPVTPVRVSQGRNWGPIVLFAGAGVVALLIIVIAAIPVLKKANEGTWQERVAGIEGLINYWESNAPWVNQREHQSGVLQYETNPPAGGNHNGAWQNCMGDVYTEPIAKEHAVHSLEHGAVWVTYRPDLPADQVEMLASKVRDRSYVMMSPYPDLDVPISLQAWGYQLKVDSADDARIDTFINALRQNATIEPGAVCSRGITESSDTPFDLGDGMGQ